MLVYVHVLLQFVIEETRRKIKHFACHKDVTCPNMVVFGPLIQDPVF